MDWIIDRIPNRGCYREQAIGGLFICLWINKQHTLLSALRTRKNVTVVLSDFNILSFTKHYMYISLKYTCL